MFIRKHFIIIDIFNKLEKKETVSLCLNRTVQLFGERVFTRENDSC
jgi:hypothetical protein